MSKATFYVAPWSVAAAQQRACEADPEGEPFYCHRSTASWESLASDPSQLVLGHVHWGANWAARERFEAQPGVIPLGEAWDPVPPEAVPVLEALRASMDGTRAARVGVLTDVAPVDTAQTVGDALRHAVPSWAHEIFA